MGEKIISNTGDNQKKQMVVESIRKGVETYLSQNIDRYGFISVDLLMISEDLRSATIYIKTQEPTKSDALISMLNGSKKDVTQHVKRFMDTRYFPKIDFREGDDENLVF